MLVLLVLWSWACRKSCQESDRAMCGREGFRKYIRLELRGADWFGIHQTTYRKN